MTCAPTEDSSTQSDQSLRCPHEETLGLELPVERIVKMDAQAELRLCWAHMSLCWFCRAVAHMFSIGAGA